MPDWTDANLHDPGVTVVELLAWSLLGCLAGLSLAAYIRRRRRRRTQPPPGQS